MNFSRKSAKNRVCGVLKSPLKLLRACAVIFVLFLVPFASHAVVGSADNACGFTIGCQSGEYFDDTEGVCACKSCPSCSHCGSSAGTLAGGTGIDSCTYTVPFSANDGSGVHVWTYYTYENGKGNYPVYYNVDYTSCVAGKHLVELNVAATIPGVAGIMTGCNNCDTGYYCTGGANPQRACTNAPANAEYTGSSKTANGCAWQCSAGYYKNGSACSACTSVGNTTSTQSCSDTTVSITNGTRNGTNGVQTCNGNYTGGNAGNGTAAAQCTGCSSYGACSYTWSCSCNTGYHVTGSGASCSCDVNTYTVKYNLNGGDGTAPTDTTCTYGASCSLNAGYTATYYRAGYVLKGWSTSSTATSGSFSVSNLTSTNGGAVTVYAVWSACAAGTYKSSSSNARTSCSNCTGRTKYSAAGASECITVKYYGYYTTGCNSSGNNCTGQAECEPGNRCNDGVKTPCPAGTYVPITGAGACWSCRGATYQDETVAISCKECPAQTDGWIRGTGEGWTSYTECTQIKTPSYCSDGFLRQTATGPTTWGTTEIGETLIAMPGAVVNGMACNICSADSYSAGGTATACTPCTNGLRSPAGSDEVGDCGRILAYQPNGASSPTKIYLRSEKKTSPSLAALIGGAVFYGNMTPVTETQSGNMYIGYDDKTWRLHNDISMTAVFWATTTPNTSVFSFNMSAMGSFIVDWGDGTIETIVRPDTAYETTYSHTYAKPGKYTIGFGGRATGYAGSYPAAISFEGNQNLAGIDGNLMELFPPSDRFTSPSFADTFAGCTNLVGTIPENLFAYPAGYFTRYGMFTGTFDGCSGLSGNIPSGMFAGLWGMPRRNLFDATFRGCSGLTGEIPWGLFGKLERYPEDMAFYRTFYGCTNLTGPTARMADGTRLYDMLDTDGTPWSEYKWVFDEMYTGTGIDTND